MKNTDLFLAVSGSVDSLQTDTTNTARDLARDFQPQNPNELTNSEADELHSMHYYMIRHAMLAAQHSFVKKEFEQSKNILDDMVGRLGGSPLGTPGTTQELHDDGTLAFSKKQNKDGTSTLVVDLLTELARLGVEKAVIDKAMANATKPKRGNVYYEITVV